MLLLTDKHIEGELARNYNKKGYKSTENQFSKNSIVQTIESPAINASGLEAKRKYKTE